MTVTIDDATAQTYITQLETIQKSLTPPPTPVPTGYTNRSTPDPKVWAAPAFQEDFPMLAAEGAYLTTYKNWNAYPDTYESTDKHGYYDPNRISVIDLPTGERAMQCRMVPGSKNTNKKPSGCAPQPKFGSQGDGRTKGEKVEFRVKVTEAADNYHVVPLTWPLKDSLWPAEGEADYLETDLKADGSALVQGWLHVQNGGPNGEGQVRLLSNVKLTDWVTVGYERIPGVSFKWFVNGQLLKTVNASDLKSPYGIPNDWWRHVLQFEPKGQPTAEAKIVVDWFTIWPLVGEAI